MPGGKYVCSASMSAALGKDDVRPVAARTRPIRKLFSKQQRAFYDAHAPAGIALDDLSILGPIFVLKTKFTPERFGRPMVAEFWLYPDATAMLELLDEMPAGPDVPDGRRSPVVARAAWRQGVRRTEHEDPQGPRRLLGSPARRSRCGREGRRPTPADDRRSEAAGSCEAAGDRCSEAPRGHCREAQRRPEAAGPKARWMTADRPARPARRALDELSLPVDRPEIDERLTALGLGDIEDRLAALEAYETLPAESNRLYTTYIDLRAAALEDAAIHWAPAGTQVQVPVPEGASGLLEFTDGDLTASALSSTAIDAGVEFTTIADFLARKRDRGLELLDNERAAGRRQVRPADTGAVDAGRRPRYPRRRPSRAADHDPLGLGRAGPRAADADARRARRGRRGLPGRGARARPPMPSKAASRC